MYWVRSSFADIPSGRGQAERRKKQRERQRGSLPK
jgi:hypothetical protein